MADNLPGVDDILGAPASPASGAPHQAPSVDDILGTPQSNESGFFPLVGKSLKAYSDGVIDSLKESESETAQEQQVKYILGSNAVEDYKKGLSDPVGLFNEAALRGLVLPAWNIGQAIFAGAEKGGNVAGAPITRAAQSLSGEAPNYNPETSAGGVGTFLTQELPMATGMQLPGDFMGIPHLPPLPLAARAAGAIGVPESVYMGTRAATEGEAAGEMRAATAMNPPEMKPVEEAPAAAMPPADVHAAAYNIAPEVMRPYRELEMQRDQLRLDIEAATTERDRAATEPLDTEIADLQEKVDEATKNGNKTVYSDILDKKIAERDAALEQARGEDSEQMAALRQQLQETDYKMRDMAPQVSAAYRTAQEYMSTVEAVAPVKAEEPVADGETAPEPQKPNIAAQHLEITDDVAQKLVAAGRPKEEADAAAQLVAEHYQARSERFEGKKGTAAEMYKRDMAEIKAGKGKVPARELAQNSAEYEKAVEDSSAASRKYTAIAEKYRKGEISDEEFLAARKEYDVSTKAFDDAFSREQNGQAIIPGAEGISEKELIERRMQGALKSTKAQKDMDVGMFGDEGKQGEMFQKARGKIRLATDDTKATITLMKSSNASTFIHETGHHWLDELLRDARDEEAPADIKKDAATVRKWLNSPEGTEIATKEHEKFARGFERYLMEGTAPSRALAGVFAKFKNWLTAIYQTVERLRSPITDDIRDVFDRLLASKPEKTIIAPEQEPGKMLADIHEADAEHTAPEHAAPVSDAIRGEVDKTAKLHEPEVHDEITAATAKASGGAGQAGETGGNAETGKPAGEGGAAAQPGAVAGSGGQATPQGGTARGAAPIESVYAKVPKEPLGLADWIKKQGGINDAGGDIRSTLGGARFRPGLIKNKGANIDDMAMRAWEAGYFPEKMERPTVNEFLDKLNEDLRGNKQYSRNDEDAARAYHEALGHNAEVDKLADELGVDAKNMTKGEFWDIVADRKSLEEQEELLTSYNDAATEEYEKWEQSNKEWLESRGEAWEPETVNSRTLEDLENERRQEEAAGNAETGAGQPGEPRNAGTDTQPGAGGVRQGGSGTEPNGRPGEAPGEGEPTGGGAGSGEPAGTSSRKSAATVVDKAGNIRLDNINTTEDIKNFMRESAARNDDFSAARRGVVSDGQVLDFAAMMGLDPSFVDRRVLGEAFNAEQIKVVEKMLAQSLTDVRKATDKFNASGKTQADADALMAALAKHDMIQGTFSAVTAEAGRALRATRKTQSFWTPDDLALNDFLQKRKEQGMTLNQLEEVSKFASKLNTPEQLAMFMESSKNTRFKDAIMQYYINALISGPLTHMRYSIGNAINALWTPLVELPIAAAYGKITGAEDGVLFGEAAAQLFALTKGAREGWMAAGEAFKTGISAPLAGERAMSPDFMASRDAIPGLAGKVINLPSRSVSAIHSFFKALRYEQNIQGLAYRMAAKEGLADEAMASRIADLTAHPTPEMIESATHDALKELYMAPSQFDSAAANLVRFTNKNMLAKIMMPFIRIGTQITRNAFIERTPIGFLDKEVRANLLGVNGAAAKDMQLAKITAGTALVGTLAMMTAEGLATGDGPDDPKERATWLLTHTPNSITVGNIRIPYQGLGSLGMLMRFSANMVETVKYWKGDDDSKLAFGFMKGVTKSVMDDNFMRGAKDALDAIYHPEEYGSKYMQDFATNWLPFSVGMGQVSREIDPYHREVHDIFSAARNRVPGMSEDLMPRRDMFGAPIMNGSNYAQYANDPVVQRLQALQIGVGRLERKINGVPLTDQQYDDYSRLAGKQTWMMLHVLMQPGFELQPAGVQIQSVNKAIEHAREIAKTMVKLNPANANIMQQAIAHKQAIFAPAEAAAK